jgi:hypothetical protein
VGSCTETTTSPEYRDKDRRPQDVWAKPPDTTTALLYCGYTPATPRITGPDIHHSGIVINTVHRCFPNAANAGNVQCALWGIISRAGHPGLTKITHHHSARLRTLIARPLVPSRLILFVLGFCLVTLDRRTPRADARRARGPLSGPMIEHLATPPNHSDEMVRWTVR